MVIFVQIHTLLWNMSEITEQMCYLSRYNYMQKRLLLRDVFLFRLNWKKLLISRLKNAETVQSWTITHFIHTKIVENVAFGLFGHFLKRKPINPLFHLSVILSSVPFCHLCHSVILSTYYSQQGEWLSGGQVV